MKKFFPGSKIVSPTFELKKQETDLHNRYKNGAKHQGLKLPVLHLWLLIFLVR
jgi:hypothetical protein